MSILTEKMDLLVHTIDEWGCPISDYLNFPLTKEEIDADTAHLPFQVPNEIYDLYQWHNGVDDPEIRFLLFPNGEQFLPLNQSLDEYEEISNTYGAYDEFLLYCFPFSASEESWSLLSSNSQPIRPDLLSVNSQHLIPELRCPILGLYQGLSVTYVSFLAMLDTEIACFREGAYSLIDPTEQVPDVDETLRRQIWARFNPGL